MKNVLDYLNTLEPEFLERFYCISVRRDSLHLQGHANANNLIAVCNLGAITKNDAMKWIDVEYTHDKINVQITLTLLEQD